MMNRIVPRRVRYCNVLSPRILFRERVRCSIRVMRKSSPALPPQLAVAPNWVPGRGAER